MMLWQGALAFEIWTGRKMPIEYIQEQMFEKITIPSEPSKITDDIDLALGISQKRLLVSKREVSVRHIDSFV